MFGTQSESGIKQQRYFSFTLYVFLLLITVVFTSCQPWTAREDSQNEAVEPEDMISEEEELRQRFENAYANLENPDSLSKAYHYLIQLRKYDVDETWYNLRMSEITFLIGTYTEIIEDSSKTLYYRGYQAALNVLQQNAFLQRYITLGEGTVDTVLTNTSVDSLNLQATYFWSVNYLFWMRSEQPISRLVARKKIERAIQFIRKAAPDYRWAAVERLRGLVLTISPDGDLNQAKKAFEQSINQGNGFLENHFFYGRYYGVLLQDRDLFLDQMNNIINHDITGAGEYSEINALIKKYAEKSLQDVDSFFFTMR